jgi:hypothetical protein
VLHLHGSNRLLCERPCEFYANSYASILVTKHKGSLFICSLFRGVAAIDYGHEDDEYINESIWRYWYPPITYYWTVPLILDHSYLVGILTSSKIADAKVSGF